MAAACTSLPVLPDPACAASMLPSCLALLSSTGHVWTMAMVLNCHVVLMPHMLLRSMPAWTCQSSGNKVHDQHNKYSGLNHHHWARHSSRSKVRSILCAAARLLKIKPRIQTSNFHAKEWHTWECKWRSAAELNAPCGSCSAADSRSWGLPSRPACPCSWLSAMCWACLHPETGWGPKSGPPQVHLQHISQLIEACRLVSTVWQVGIGVSILQAGGLLGLAYG